MKENEYVLKITAFVDSKIKYNYKFNNINSLLICFINLKIMKKTNLKVTTCPLE